MKTLIQLSDQQLVHLYQGGNSAALSTLVLRYKSKLFTSICLLVKDKHLAEDIFQDLFIRVIVKLKSGQYKDEGKFLAWTMRIAHNLCLDHFRKTKRIPVIKSSDDKAVFEMPNFSMKSAEDRLIDGERYIRIRRMLDTLPEEQREVIILRQYAEMDFKEIAALMNISINTALGRMRYGLLNLRKNMVSKNIAF